MLSLLIPVYNRDVRPLVNALRGQAEKTGIDYEILCIDDDSEDMYKKVNASLAGLPGVRYIELPENIGRARIRNVLAREAKFDALLYLDCDARLISPDYVAAYIPYIDGQVVYGGTSYSAVPPENKELQLHWYYGTTREALPTDLRKQIGYPAFKTNNFLCPKLIIDSIPFNENVSRYGHEDTLFANQLEEQQVKLIHIDNPVSHEGLEPMDEFLNKQYEAIDNLVELEKKGINVSTRLTKYYAKVSKFGLSPVIAAVGKTMHQYSRWKLKKNKPNIKYLDLLKFTRYHNLKKKS